MYTGGIQTNRNNSDETFRNPPAASRYYRLENFIATSVRGGGKKRINIKIYKIRSENTAYICNDHDNIILMILVLYLYYDIYI